MNLAGHRILVVEDDESNRDLFAAILTICGAEVVEASSVSDAMARLMETPPTAIVSDISMPGEDGYALLARLRTSGLQIPTIAVTAHRYEHTPERTLAAGFRGYLMKPVEPDRLCHMVAAVVGAE